MSQQKYLYYNVQIITLLKGIPVYNILIMRPEFFPKTKGYLILFYFNKLHLFIVYCWFELMHFNAHTTPNEKLITYIIMISMKSCYSNLLLLWYFDIRNM